MGVKRLTQRDIARLSGVSQATVSLVLNGTATSAARIPAETRERVAQVIRDTGYVADPVARRMAKGQNRILGVFTYEPAFPSAQADFYAPFLLGIEEAAEQLGYDLLLLTAASRDARGRKRLFAENNRLRLADGCLILGNEFDREELARLVAGDYPFVAVGRRDDAGGPVRYVGADYVSATAALVGRAIGLGHRRFAFFGTTGGTESGADRWRGFNTGLAEGGGALVHLADAGVPDPAAAVAALREAGATVAFFGDLADAIAIEAAAVAAGLSLPAALSICVLGNRFRSDREARKYTSYAIPREQMAAKATRMLVETIAGAGAVEQILLDCPLADGRTLVSSQSREH
jgi:DNA-binding LacI/PurR family transcriptional regulator